MSPSSRRARSCATLTPRTLGAARRPPGTSAEAWSSKAPASSTGAVAGLGPRKRGTTSTTGFAQHAFTVADRLARVKHHGTNDPHVLGHALARARGTAALATACCPRRHATARSTSRSTRRGGGGPATGTGAASSTHTSITACSTVRQMGLHAQQHTRQHSRMTATCTQRHTTMQGGDGAMTAR